MVLANNFNITAVQDPSLLIVSIKKTKQILTVHKFCTDGNTVFLKESTIESNNSPRIALKIGNKTQLK